MHNAFRVTKMLLHQNIQINMQRIRNFTPRRALMYVPGDDLRKLNKTLKIDADCIVMDCEDGVALNRKDSARDTIRKILDEGKPKKGKSFDWAVRVNSVESGLCKDDLSNLLSARNLPDTVLLPKVNDISHVQWFSEQVKKCIESDKTINLIIYIESAKAMLDVVEICKSAIALSQASKFVLSSLVFGSDDLCASIGVTRTNDSTEIMYARQKLVLVAKAFRLQAIDMVYIQYKDLEGLKKQSEEGARMGYTGKQVIHPNQVPIVQQAFLPNQKQIDWATGLLKSFEEHQKSGKGAFTYKGAMIDMPTMKQAQNIINLIRLA